jgi:hypothetical protein
VLGGAEVVVVVGILDGGDADDDDDDDEASGAPERCNSKSTKPLVMLLELSVLVGGPAVAELLPSCASGRSDESLAEMAVAVVEVLGASVVVLGEAGGDDEKVVEVVSRPEPRNDTESESGSSAKSSSRSDDE